MSTFTRLSFLALVAIVFTATGCGGSKADAAAQEMFDIAKEAKDNPAKLLENMGKMIEIGQTIEAEMKKMSPEERKAFDEKWKKKFEDAGLGGGNFGSD